MKTSDFFQKGVTDKVLSEMAIASFLPVCDA
jgi:hypothetical protein